MGSERATALKRWLCGSHAVALALSIVFHVVLLTRRTNYDLRIGGAPSPIEVVERKDGKDARHLSGARYPNKSAFADSSGKDQPSSGSNWGRTLDGPSTFEGEFARPEYPATAQLRQEEGRVLIGVNIVAGIVDKTEILQSTGFSSLDEAALSAIKTWRFNPSVTTSFVQPVTFKLDR